MAIGDRGMAMCDILQRLLNGYSKEGGQRLRKACVVWLGVLNETGPRMGACLIMAVGLGFEPREGINPQRFSRPPLSTTQPAHRKLVVLLALLCEASAIIQFCKSDTRG
jgi:hypothetical protein